MSSKAKEAILSKYKTALSLTPEEQQMARDMHGNYLEHMDNAFGKGVIRSTVEAYHPDAWKQEQDPGLFQRLFGDPTQEANRVAALNRIRHQTDNGYFDTNTNAAKQRIFATEFDLSAVEGHLARAFSLPLQLVPPSQNLSLPKLPPKSQFPFLGMSF